MNFEFSYGMEVKYTLNTHHKRLKRFSSPDDSAIVRFKLPKKEMKRIFDMMDSMELDTFPQSFKILGGLDSTTVKYPCSYFIIHLYFKTYEKHVSWDDCRGAIPPDEKSQALERLQNLIVSIIQSQKKYKKLPALKRGYI